MVRRTSLAISKDKPRRVYQVLAVDEFGEVGERKRFAERLARRFGHQLTSWHRRPNDPAGRWNSYCADCNGMAVVVTEARHGEPDLYGSATTTDCNEVRLRPRL